MTGQKIGRLTVIERCGSTKNNKALWLCKCECGGETKATTGDLRSGNTKSCGCLQKETTSDVKKQYNRYDLTNDYGIGYDSNNNEFYFDLEDYEKIKKHYWYVDNRKNYGYVYCKTSNLILHRFVMDCNDEDLEVDHICHNRADCRKAYLRIVTSSQNNMNRTPKNETSGISYHTRDNKWQAYITKDYKDIHLGYFDNKEDAIRARKQAEEKYFGEYSYDNSMKLLKNNKGE